MSEAIPPSEFYELIRGQARLEEKIDNFMTSQSTMRTEIDTIKADVAEIKAASAITKSYVNIVVGGAIVVWTLFATLLWPWVQQKLFGI